MNYSPRLALPLLAPAQASKHITVNEALLRLEAAGRISVVSRTIAAPLETVEDGARFIVPEDIHIGNIPSGQIAVRQNGGWWALPPENGQRVWCEDEGAALIYRDSAWHLEEKDTLQTTDRLGINTVGDMTNRLSVKSDAVLFSHNDVTPGSGDVRLILNRSGSDDVAGLIFQSGYSGRVALELGAQADFRINVSSDGSTFTEALRIGSDGVVVFPQGFIDPTALMSSPVLYGAPSGGLSGYDTFYVDPVSGDDSASGLSIANAVHSFSGLMSRLKIGRRVVVMLMGDIEIDRMFSIAYPLAKLDIRGYASDGSGYVQRRITVRDAVNFPGYSGGFQIHVPASIAFFKIDIELSSASTYPFLYFDQAAGYVNTHSMTVSRTGTGSACLLGTPRSHVASYHEGFVIDASAAGHIFDGVSAGLDPNDVWSYPTNLNSA